MEDVASLLLTIDIKTIDIVDLFNILYRHGGMELASQFLAERAIQIRDLSKSSPHRIMFLKYFEHSREWSYWARLCRGIILALIGDEWVCIKRQLERGPEVFTGIHLTAGITETQDAKIGKIDHLSDEHQEVIHKLLQPETDFPVLLSMKKDGSLIGIEVFAFESKEGRFVEDYITNHTSDQFAKSLLDRCRQKNLPIFLVLSSSGVLLIGQSMLEYTLTSILCSYGVDFYVLRELVSDRVRGNISNLPSVLAFETYSCHVDRLIENVVQFWEHIYPSSTAVSDSHVLCLSFEAICPNITDAWGQVHTELAVSYPNASFSLLGASTHVGKSSGFYRPHFEFTHDILTTCHMYTPLYWETSSSQIGTMMTDLSAVIFGQMTQEEYLGRYKPAGVQATENEVMSSVSVFQDRDPELDFEGFILYTLRSNPSTMLASAESNYSFGSETCDQSICDSSYKNPYKEYLYSKVKTPEYYLGHSNAKYGSLADVVKLPDCFQYAKRVRLFFSEGEDGFRQQLCRISCNLKVRIDELLNATVLDALMFGSHSPEQQPNEAIEMIEQSLGILKGFGTKALSSFSRQDRETQIKMIISALPTWKTIVLEAFKEEFPMIDEADGDSWRRVKPLMIKLEFWQDDNSLALEELVNPESRLAQDLFSLISKYLL